MKSEKRFSQVYEGSKISEFPLPEHLFIPVGKYQGNKNLFPGRKVKKYDQIVPGLFSPVNGEILEILKMPVDGAESEVIKIGVSDRGDVESGPGGKDHPAVSPGDIFTNLKNSGYNIEDTISSDRDIIISAVDTDPLCSVSQQILRENRQLLEENFDLFRKLVQRDTLYFAVSSHQFDMVWKLQTRGVTVVRVPAVYPNGIPELITDSLRVKFDLHSPLFISIEDFLNICRIAAGEKIVFDKVLTITDNEGTRNIRVTRGTPVKNLLAASDIKKAGKVIAGGPMRGYAVYNFNTPVTEKISSIYIQYENDIVRAVNNPCLNCGRCNRHCPASLSVNLITRYSEFSVFDKCEELGVENCIECGLCSFYCPSGRSLVQLIQLAKSEINKSEEEVEQ